MENELDMAHPGLVHLGTPAHLSTCSARDGVVQELDGRLGVSPIALTADPQRKNACLITPGTRPASCARHQFRAAAAASQQADEETGVRAGRTRSRRIRKVVAFDARSRTPRTSRSWSRPTRTTDYLRGERHHGAATSAGHLSSRREAAMSSGKNAALPPVSTDEESTA